MKPTASLVAAMLAAILESAGRRVGLFTSPHLLDLRERIRVDGRPIEETVLADGVEALCTLVARLDATMFEALTALALDHFASDAVEVAVLEAGLGGRLDSTSVGRPAVQVITRIDYDHQLYLGDTLEAIAGEKAAIIRSGVALSARQEPAVETVIARQAALVGVPLLVEGRDLRVRVRGASLDGQWLDLEGPGWRLDDVRCSLLGVFQPVNALLAAAAARALGAGDAAIRAGLGRARWPGRFQLIRPDPSVIVDGALAYQNLAGTRPDIFSFESRGETYWAQFRPFQLGANRVIQIAIAIPEDDLLGVVQQQRLLFAAIAMLAMFGASLMAIALSRRFSSPLRELARKSQRMGQLDLAPAPAIESSLTEVDQLAEVTPGLTAHPAVNAVAAVCEAPPGLLTTAELPVIAPTFS